MHTPKENLQRAPQFLAQFGLMKAEPLPCMVTPQTALLLAGLVPLTVVIITKFILSTTVVPMWFLAMDQHVFSRKQLVLV